MYTPKQTEELWMLSRPHTVSHGTAFFAACGVESLCCEKSNVPSQKSTSSACDRNSRIFKRSLVSKKYTCGIVQQHRK